MTSARPLRSAAGKRLFSAGEKRCTYTGSRFRGGGKHGQGLGSGATALGRQHMSYKDLDLEAVVGRRLVVPGQLADPVTVEDFEDWGDVINLRVRTAQPGRSWPGR